MGDGFQGEVDYFVLFWVVQVGVFVGVVEWGDGVYVVVDQVFDGVVEGWQVEIFVGGEGGDGVVDDVVDGCGYWMYL